MSSIKQISSLPYQFLKDAVSTTRWQKIDLVNWLIQIYSIYPVLRILTFKKLTQIKSDIKQPKELGVNDMTALNASAAMQWCRFLVTFRVIVFEPVC